MSRKITQLIGGVLVLLFAASAAATETETTVPAGERSQTSGGGFEISWHKIASGGTLVSGGGGWALAGTIGQHDASGRDTLQGGQWSLTGGFWAPGFETNRLELIFHDRFQD